MEDLLVSRARAAEMLGISLRLLDYMIQRRELPTVRLGRRVLLRRETLERVAKYGVGAVRKATGGGVKN